jgi:hypothetical protein
MANNQDLRDVIDEIVRQLARVAELLDNQENPPGGNDDAANEPVNAPEVEPEEAFEPEGGDNEVQGLAELLGGLNFAHQTRSRVQVINGEVLATGYGYNGDTYTSERGYTHDMNSPPPGKCFKCGGNHWRKNCPRYRN